MNINLNPDPSTIHRFLELIGGPRPLVLISKDPDGGLVSRAFENIDRAVGWAEEENQKARNIYYIPSDVKPTWSGPNNPKKEDIEVCRFLYADNDPGKGMDRDTERQRILALYTTDIPNALPPPTIIVDSGNGYQALWAIEEMPPAKAESKNKQISIILQGDRVQNCNRLLRVPGTVNYPDAKKRARGRVPTLSALVSYRDGIYPATRFQDASDEPKGNRPGAESAQVPEFVSITDLESMGVPPYTLALIVQGRDCVEPDRYPSRSEVLWRVLCDLARAGVTEQQMAGVVTDPNYGISASVLEKRDPTAYAHRPVSKAVDAAISPRLAEMNSKYAVVKSVGGKCRVMVFEPSPLDGGKQLIHLQSFKDFRDGHSNVLVDVNGRTKPLGAWWLEHPRRRQYDGLVFRPGDAEVLGNNLNLWRGFGVVPGDCDLLLRHVREILADNNPVHERYILDWAACAVQNPGDRAGVALVFRGGQGAGKGLFGVLMKELFGQHGLHISSPDHLMGHFNYHLRDTSLLFADEAFWPGHRGQEGALKRLITEPTLMLEAKGRDSEQAANSLHIIMASNESWVVPAGPDERRYAVFDVSDARKQDYDWFSALHKELDNGGREAFLHFLLNRPLGDFHPRNKPNTKALTEQKVRTLRPEHRYIEIILQEGVLRGAALRGTGSIATSALIDDAHRRVPRTRDMGIHDFRDPLRQLGATPYSNGDLRGWRFPDLPEARAAWERIFGEWAWDYPNLDHWSHIEFARDFA